MDRSWRLGRTWHLDDLALDPRLGREPGVYLFSLTYTGPPRHVGRSDTDLLRRVRGREYRYYRFKHCDSPETAYRWECLYYHQHLPTIENERHPAKPRGLAATCPVCHW